MQQAFGRASIRALFSGLLLLSGGRAAALETARVSGIATALGASGAGLAADGDALFGNPALLLFAPRTELRIEAAIDSSASSALVALRWPTWNGAGFGLGLTRDAARASTLGDPRLDARLGYAQRLGRGVACGGTLLLRRSAAGSNAGSWGADLGLHVEPGALRHEPAPGAAPRFGIGLVLHNALQPAIDDGSTSKLESRRLEAGAAYRFTPRTGWSTSALAGWTSDGESRFDPQLGALVSWRERVDVAASWRARDLRCGLGVRWPALRVDYTLSHPDATLRHALSVQVGLGHSLQARRAAREQALEIELSRRLAREIEARQTQQIDLWLEEGRIAGQRREFGRAADLYRNVLTWRPDAEEARRGLQRAQFEAYVQEADTLAARHDDAAAAGLLAQALGLCPGDSLAVARLQAVQGRVDQAQRARRAAAEQFRLGLDAYASQRYAIAVRCFEAVLQIDPRDASAAEYLDKSRQAGQSRMQSALREARARLDKRDLDGARAHVAVVLESDPKQPEANRILAQIGREQERLAQEQRFALERRVTEARRTEDGAREDRSPPGAVSAEVEASYERGVQRYRAGDLVGAMQAWEEVARSAPHYKEVDQYLLRVYRVCGLESYTEGRLQRAIEIWDKAMKLEPTNQQVRRYLNQAHAKLNRVQSGERDR